tara:strand:+ start:208 stop:651 length:444 start_codon:yes stop_codon:yes gene_type:complete
MGTTLGHKSYITHSGYGYSQRRCQNITSWFIKTFYPRHKLDVDIIHRGLLREGAFGWCDCSGGYSRPREFVIELHTNMNKELYTKTLLHELFHMMQWINGSLTSKKCRMYYRNEPVDNYEYEDQPHEIAARAAEESLYEQYITDCKK